MINTSYYVKSHWNRLKSTLLIKFKFSQERLGGFCSEFHQWKTKPYWIILWNNFSFLVISFWNIIPNKMDAFLLGHGVYSCVQWILYMPFDKSSTHSYPRPHTLPTPTPTHTPHTPTSHPVTFTHNSLTHSRPPTHTHTESPPLHHLPSAQNGYLENVFFFSSSSKTNSVHAFRQ